MTAPIWKRDEIESPCVQICVMHPKENICAGCYRTMDEITRWSVMSSDERAGVMADLPDRAPRLKRRRGGRDARVAR